MRRLALALALAACALPLAAAAAQPPALDPAALELARFLMARDPAMYHDADIGRFQLRLQQALLAQNICDPTNSECQSQATLVAREFAPAYRSAERLRSEQAAAYQLAEALRPEELRRILQYVRGDEGTHLLDALALLRDQDRLERRRRALGRLPGAGAGDPLAEAGARFRQAARNLPAPAPH